MSKLALFHCLAVTALLVSACSDEESCNAEPDKALARLGLRSKTDQVDCGRAEDGVPGMDEAYDCLQTAPPERGATLFVDRCIDCFYARVLRVIPNEGIFQVDIIQDRPREPYFVSVEQCASLALVNNIMTCEQRELLTSCTTRDDPF